MNRSFARSRHNHPQLSFLFPMVGLVEHYGLKNFGSLWCAAAAGIQTFQKKRKTGASFCRWGMDANPFWVALECRDTGGTCPSVSWCFWLMGVLSKMIKEYMRKGC
jgi:hypothetical protein